MPKKKTQPIDFSALGPADGADVPAFKIVNVVSTSRLGTSVDLKKLALRHAFFEFNPLTFAAATLRLSYPRTTCLLFASGNMVITGAANTFESRLAARTYCHVLQKCGLRVMFKEFGIQNIVACAYVGFVIKLQDIADAFSPYCSYDPDLFPGLVFRSIKPKLVFLIFRSGKIVITGAKKTEEIAITFHSLFKNIIVKYKDTGSASSSEYRTKIIREKMEQNNVEY